MAYTGFNPKVTSMGANTITNQNGSGAPNCSNGVQIGGNATLMTYIKGTISSTFTFNGVLAGSTGAYTIPYVRIDNLLHVSLPVNVGVGAGTGTGSTKLTANTALPSTIRPTTTQGSMVVQMRIGGLDSTNPGFVELSTGGILTISASGLLTGIFTALSTNSGTEDAVTLTFFLG